MLVFFDSAVCNGQSPAIILRAWSLVKTKNGGTKRGTLRRVRPYLADSKEWLGIIYTAIVLLESGYLAFEASDHLLRRSAAVDFLLKIGKRLDEEERRDHGQKEVVEPHRLIDVQRLQRRFVEYEDRAERHRSMIVIAARG
jgi:hypothetical protein